MTAATLALGWYARRRLHRWDATVTQPHAFQERLLQRLVRQAARSRFGEDHRFSDVDNYASFRDAVPLRQYEDVLPYIDRIKQGERDVLYPGRPKYFAKTSGTTADVKHLPITTEFARTYAKTGVDMLFCFARSSGKLDFLTGSKLLLQGSPALEDLNGILLGRMSGISYHLVPGWLRLGYLPSYDVNVIADWQTKVRRIAKQSANRDLRVLAGIPPWIMMYLDEVVEHTGAGHVIDVFPNLAVYFHGGVDFEPYRRLIIEKIGAEIPTRDTYTASEGFLAFQTDGSEDGMTLCSDSGIFYEFVETAALGSAVRPYRIPLAEVECGKDYAIVLSTLAGLWAYVIGDTVRFTSVDPYRFVITGRTAQFTSLFGEHVIEAEIKQAMRAAIDAFALKTRSFTVAPRLLPERRGSHHEWWIEFDEVPANLDSIAEFMDREMRRMNCYYDDLVEGQVLGPLKIVPVERDGFQRSFLDEDLIDGQNKVPVVANDRGLVSRLEPYRVVVAGE